MRKRLFFFILAILVVTGEIFAQTSGDIFLIGEKRFQLSGENLIPNGSFSDGFTHWTDGTSSAAELSPDNFVLEPSGGVDDGAYIKSLKNEGGAGAGTIGTGWAIEAGKTYYFSYYVKHQDGEAAAETAQYLKVSLTNDKTNTAEPLVLIGGSQVGANGEWTKNETAFTNSTPYAYLVARFRWLSTQFAFDDFRLFEAIEMPNQAVLQNLIDEAKEIYNADNQGAADLLEAIALAETFLDEPSIDIFNNAVGDLTKAIQTYKLLQASAVNPIDVTYLISNPSFEAGNFSGWVNNGMQTQNNTSFPVKEGSYYVEKWVANTEGNNVPDISVTQQLTGIPDGSYSLTVAAQNLRQPDIEQPGGYIFGNSVEGEVGAVGDYSIDNIPVVGGSLTIGFKTVSSTANYVACDNFRLYYKGVDLTAVKAELQSRVEAAKEITGSMQSSVAEALQNAITDCEELIANQQATSSQLSEAAANLIACVDAAKESVALYESLRAAIDAALLVKEEFKLLPGKAEFEVAIAAAELVYTTAEADQEGIEEAIETLKLAQTAFRLSDEAPMDITFLIVNPSFESDWNGWTNVGMGRQGNTAFTVKEGSYYVEKWVANTAGNNVPDVSVTQTIKGLVTGTYRILAAAQNVRQDNPDSPQPGAFIFGNEESVEVGETKDDYQLDVEVTDGTLTFGFKTVNSTANYTCIDNFRLSLMKKTVSGINGATPENRGELLRIEYYNAQGVRVNQPVASGLYIVRKVYDSNRVETEKIIFKAQ